MTIYYPYAVLKTKVDIKYFKYELSVYNSVNNKTIKMLNPAPMLPTSQKFKKIDSNLYQTECLSLDSTKIGEKNLKDCVVVFKLYRINHGGKDLLIDTYILPDKIEKYVKPDFNKNIHQIKYEETTFPTKVVLDSGVANTYEIILNRNRAFQCIDPGCRPGESKDPFTKKQIEAGLQARLNNPFPAQDSTSLCGPAAYFFCLINLSPSSYKKVVKQLWESGKADIGNLSIKPSNDGCRRVRNFYNEKTGGPKIPPIDWITLASLRESENTTYRLNDPDNEVAGITTWNELFGWFEQSNFKGLKKYPFQNYTFSSNVIAEINNYAGQDYYVVSLISASLLSGGGSSGTNLFPDHWIVWMDKLKDNKGNSITALTEPYNTKVKLKFFSWGDHEQLLKDDISYYDFMKKTFFAFIVKKEKF